MDFLVYESSKPSTLNLLLMYEHYSIASVCAKHIKHSSFRINHPKPTTLGRIFSGSEIVFTIVAGHKYEVSYLLPFSS